MLGYKVFHENLNSRGFQYEIGKTYQMDEEPVPGHRGFHACLVLDDVFKYCRPFRDTYRICKVDLAGTVAEGHHKVASNRITILEELDYKTAFDAHSKNIDHLAMLIQHGDDSQLDILVNHPHTSVRCEVAKRGRPQDLDILVRDKSWLVRREVARHGRPQDLDILVRDIHWAIRSDVAYHGRHQDLDILVRDRDESVRLEVARHGRPQDLDILVHDEDEYVRRNVANHGRPQDLDILVHDKDEYVRINVAKHGRPQDLDILVHGQLPPTEVGGLSLI